MIIANDNATRQSPWARLRAMFRRPSMVETARSRQVLYVQRLRTYRQAVGMPLPTERQRGLKAQAQEPA